MLGVNILALQNDSERIKKEEGQPPQQPRHG